MLKYTLPFGTAMGINVAFSNAVSVQIDNNTVMAWISGQLAYNEQGFIIGKNDIAEQTNQCLKNIEKNLQALGGNMEDVVNMTVYVKEMKELKKIHEERFKFFKSNYPASTLIKVLGFVEEDALIEINAQAIFKA